MKVRGFTLVEMLVTLALVALVTSLLWQALATVAQLEGQLSRTRTLSNDDRLRRTWVMLALTGAMTGPQGDPIRFTGRPLRVSTYTSMPPWPGSLGPELMLLELEGNSDGQRLIARRPGNDTPLELWRWAGGDGRFDYLDAGGNWHEVWPPPNVTRAEPLPAAVRLRGPQAGVVLVALTTTQGQMLRQQDLLSDSPARP